MAAKASALLLGWRVAINGSPGTPVVLYLGGCSQFAGSAPPAEMQLVAGRWSLVRPDVPDMAGLLGLRFGAALASAQLLARIGCGIGPGAELMVALPTLGLMTALALAQLLAVVR